MQICRDWRHWHWGGSIDKIVRLSNKRLSYCLNTFLPLLSVKWPFVGQPDNFICWATSMPIASISTDLHALNCKKCSNTVNWILVELENEILFCFLHYGWFLQNLEKSFFWINMHTTADGQNQSISMNWFKL
jgi:hypothetical protein